MPDKQTNRLVCRPHATIWPAFATGSFAIEKAEATAILKSYSTAKIARGARIAYWNDLHCNLFSPLEIKPVDRAEFDATMTHDRVDQVAIVRTRSLPASIEHTDLHVARTQRQQFSILMPTEGKLQLCHLGREIALNEGDFALFDNSAPFRITFREPNQAIGLDFSPDALRAYLPAPERLCGLRMPADRGLSSIASAMLRSLWAQAECGLPAAFRPVVTKNLLEVIAASYAMEHRCAVAESSVTSTRRAQVKRFIEIHLRDSDLSATSAAKSLGLSPRYVRLVFAAEGESVSSYILRRRLEECARQLTHALWRGRSITETAFEWGFASMAHFTRAFKEQFGTTPTTYRRTSAMHAQQAEWRR